MSKLFTLVLACALLSVVSCITITKRPRIQYLKDTNPLFLNESYYAGFEPIKNKGELFFWMFESRSQPSKDPLVVWLTGGPGCSSEIALLIENGPYFVNKNNNTLRINPWSWNNNANLLFVDQPLGTGFSTAKILNKNEQQIADDFLLFLQEFVVSFPQFKGRDFYITGESYAGHYIPAISANILRKGGLNLNFKGVAIGNGLVSVYHQYPGYATYALENNLVDEKTYKSLVQGFAVCQDLVKRGLTKLALIECQAQVDRIIGNPPRFNYYDIRQKCEHLPLCYDLSFVDDFLEQSEIEHALGVYGRPWTECNNTVHTELTNDWMADLTADLSFVVQKGLRVLIYNGDRDFIVNWRGNENLANNLDWKKQAEFAKQNYTKIPSGEFKRVDNLAFYRIYEAGHMVPMDQPLVALEMLNDFIYGK